MCLSLPCGLDVNDMLGNMRGPMSKMRSRLEISNFPSHAWVGIWSLSLPAASMGTFIGFYVLLLPVLLLALAKSVAFWVSSVVSSLPVLPYFCPAGRRGGGRERSRELECPWKPGSDEWSQAWWCVLGASGCLLGRKRTPDGVSPAWDWCLERLTGTEARKS